MASILLSAAGSAAGGAIGGTLGVRIGGAIGGMIGGNIDQALFGKEIHREGARLEELSVQTSTFGKMIPQVFGSARIAGNILKI